MTIPKETKVICSSELTNCVAYKEMPIDWGVVIALFLYLILFVVSFINFGPKK